MAGMDEFVKERLRLNDVVMKYADRTTKRIWSLDHQTYEEGALPVRMKELMALVASLALRCDDCVKYHLTRCAELGVTDGELREALSIGLLIGGSITMPHLRRAYDAWDEIRPPGPTPGEQE